ncbi:MAG: hypothetical protein AAF497_02030 [Planctomycetota bacterium]
MRATAFMLALVIAVMTCADLSAQGFAPATREMWQEEGWSFAREWRPVNEPLVAEDFAKDFVEVLVAKDLERWTRLVDFELLKERASRMCETSKSRLNIQNSFNAAYERLVKQIGKQADNYKYIRHLKTKLGVGPIFRLTTEEGGVQYHLWYLLQNHEGQIKGIDIYIFNSGESLSESFGRGALLIQESKTKSFVRNLSPRNRQLFANRDDLNRMLMAQSSRDEVNVMKAYNQLPDNLKTVKFCMLYRLMAARKYSDERFDQALADFHRVYKGDISGDLVALDYYSSRKNVDALIKTVTRIQQVIHPDAHLFMIKAKACLDRGNHDICRQLLNYAHQIEPEKEDLYWLRASCESAAGEFDQTLRIFKYLVKKYDVLEFKGLDQSPHFKDFVGSEQHKEFMTFLASAKKLKTDFLSGDLE